MKKAAALAYEQYSDIAPRVVASGVGEIAKAIIKKASELDIALFCNEALVNSLVNMQVNENIPEELYSAVIEVFIWLQGLQNPKT